MLMNLALDWKSRLMIVKQCAKHCRYLCSTDERAGQHRNLPLATGLVTQSDDRLMPWPIPPRRGTTPPIFVQRYQHDQRVLLVITLGRCGDGCNDTLGRAGVPSCRGLSHLLGDHRVVASSTA